MVTIITDKLRNQTLEDVQFEPIPQSSRQSWELSTVGLSSFNFNAKPDKKDWSLPLSSSDSWRPGELKASIAAAQHQAADGVTFCPHKHPKDTCFLCDSSPCTPNAPPKKRQCRSLSIPGDGSLGKQWQPQASSIWRPVAVRSSHCGKLKSRNSPHCLPKGRVSSSSSPLSLCGGGQTSSQSPRNGRWSVTSNEYFITPPESPSPVPRPASASSGFYDSSQGSLTGPLLDPSPTPWQEALPSQRVDVFKTRSLSVEESISGVGSGLRQVVGSGAPSGSMPVISHLPSSTPSSPQRQRVPRSRSQPSVLHDRKCGLKRRRDEERPTLDLLKMKETAYDHFGRTLVSSKQRSIQFAPPSSRAGLASLFTEPPECFLGLNTIASSPLDGSSSHMSSTQTLTVVTPKASPEQDKIFKLDKFAMPGTGLSPGNRRDRLSDSGCSENEISEPSPVAFVDSEENSCSCIDSDNCGCRGADDTGEEQVFELEMNNDLDLEQIEKD